MKRNVLLFACIEKNIGDDLFIDTICKRYPDITFVISRDADYGSLSDISNLKFSRILSLWDIFNSMEKRNKIRSIVKYIGTKTTGLLLGRYFVGVMIVGNAFKNYSYKGPEQIRWLQERVSHTDRFYLLSTNFGPYNDSSWVFDCKEVFSSITDICFRDRTSYELFSEMPNTRFAADAIFSLGRREKQDQNKKMVLLSIIDCAFPGRTDDLKAVCSCYEDKMVSIANAFTSRGYSITIINSNSKQDQPAAIRILKSCDDNDRITVYNYNGDLGEVLSLYQKADYVVSTRLHTTILALLFDIPVLPVVYDIKVRGVLDVCGFDQQVIDLLDIEKIDINQAINSLIEHYCYHVPQSVIDSSNEQFEKIDLEFHNKINFQ